VSRGPVREALRALERAGLVNGVPNVGMFVRQVGLHEAVELYELRGVIFGFACGRLAERCSEEQREALKALVSRMDDAIENEDAALYYQLNLKFHDTVMEYSEHDQAARVYDSLVKEGLLLRERSLRPVTAMAESNAEHKLILKAIQRKDVQAARAEAERHHRQGKRRWLDTLSR
jgi:DNA-binding GntR family transcriptional regulator